MPPFNPKKITGHFVLLGKLAVPEPDLYKWAVWFETADRHVALTQIGPAMVSTVFLGLDHSFDPTGTKLPILFETMIRRGDRWDDQWRYETWEQAEAGHAHAVALVRQEIKDKINT